MEGVLRMLRASLKSASEQLNGPGATSVNATLHDADGLPDSSVFDLASDVLDLMSELRLMLEPRHLILADHFMGYMSTKALCAAVELDVPDVLRSGPKSLPELAEACGARPDRLGQILQTLYNNGIFAYDPSTGVYDNNSTSTLLLSDHWTQWRNWVDLYGNEFYDMARGIPTSCRKESTRSAAQVNYDTDDSMFKYFTDQGWIPRFHTTLGGGATAQAPGILADYPWEEVAKGTVLDIGGGGGSLMELLLNEHKSMKGAILETPSVIEHARANFHSPGGRYAHVAAQIPPENLFAGDFFTQIPANDVYVMKWCLHDWDDDKARSILRNIRSAIKQSPTNRLVVLEALLRDGHMGRMSRYGDLNMMVAVSGRERTEKEWTKLAEETGWYLRRIYTLRNSWPSAIEFVPKWETSKPVVEKAIVNGNQPFEHTVNHDVSGDVMAEIRFLEPWDSTRQNPYIRVDPAPGFNRINFTWKDHLVSIQDARRRRDNFSLDAHGFIYLDDPIPDETICALRGNDTGSVESLYYPHIEEFIKRVTGAPRVIIFDHTQRKRRPELAKTQNDDGKEQPATMVHVDQSEKGALRRIRMNLPDGEDVDQLLRERRVQLINVWRPLNGEVRDAPLATMDFSTVNASDMYPCDLLRGENEFRGQTVTSNYSNDQKWYYLSNHRTDEVTLIKIWDNKRDQGVSLYCAHAAFTHPNTPAQIEPRESVEVRCIVIY